MHATLGRHTTYRMVLRHPSGALLHVAPSAWSVELARAWAGAYFPGCDILSIGEA